MRYFLGVDVGSSKTDAMIVDEMGQTIGFGRAGGGNHQSVGYEGLELAIKDSLAAALRMSRVDKAHIAGAGFGVAGYDFLSDKPSHLEVISKIGLACPVEVFNDGLNGLLAAATHGIGVNVTAGSSINCRGRSKDGKEGRIVGNGATFGEYGGAKEIVLRGLQMVNYAWIKRIPHTTLTDIYLKEFGVKDVLGLMEGLSNKQYHLHPHLAIQVVDAARLGDEAARDVMTWAGEELGWLAVAVARQIGMEDEYVEIIQSGSVFGAGKLIIDPMSRIVSMYCPNAKMRRVSGPPVIGAVILGMEQACFKGYAVRDKMIRTAKKITARY